MDHPPFPEDAGIGAGLAQLMITDSQSTNVQKAKIVPIFALEHPGHLGQRMRQTTPEQLHLDLVLRGTNLSYPRSQPNTLMK